MTQLQELNITIESEVNNNPLYTGRTVVFGDGSASSKIVLIGEAPGKDEEIQRRPFVGSAGKNLTEFLGFIGMAREDIYITNLVKIRPRKLSEKTNKFVNRPPDKGEISFFAPFLFKELEIINPKVVCTLGNYPLQALAGSKSAVIGSVHGEFTQFGGFCVFPLYHPAAVIYNQSLKETYLNDLEKLKNGLHLHI